MSNEKDQNLRMLQDKVCILEGDLNKKDSLLRNLRDELVEIERKKGASLRQSNVVHSSHASGSH